MTPERKVVYDSGKPQRAAPAPKLDKLPPHAPEAEQAVLGAVLQSPENVMPTVLGKIGRHYDVFYDLRHATIYQAMARLHEEKLPIDLVNLTQALRDEGTLDEVGGIQYVAGLEHHSVSYLNIDSYLGIVTEKYGVRKLIQTCTDIVGRLYDANGDVGKLVTNAQANLMSVMTPLANAHTEEHWNIPDLLGFDTKADPNAVIGFKNGITTRYLCRGYPAWIIGQSHIGKSSIGLQMCYLWALGRSFCGITPVFKPRILIVQNENDKGDSAEATQGILESGLFTVEDLQEINATVKIIRLRGRTGADFCRWLDRQITAWRADIVYIDPLLRFAGIDVSRQDQVTRFLNDCIDPVLANTGAILLGAHHTGKPRSAKETMNWTIYDYAYAGIGSSELVNWARAIMYMRVVPDGLFELMLAKRGARAWAVHPGVEDAPALSIYLKHSISRIFWEQVTPPEEPASAPAEDGLAGKPKKSKADEICKLNLSKFFAEWPAEEESGRPVGLNLQKLAVMLENHLAAIHRIDANRTTCNRAIEHMVSSEKLSKADRLYYPGTNA